VPSDPEEPERFVVMKVPSDVSLGIYVFSFNRGVFLENCLDSVRRCARGYETVLVDDGSTDPETVAVIDRHRRYFRSLEPQSGDVQALKTGGLYANMELAMQDARGRGHQLVLFLQDDMQLVRPLLERDLAAALDFFREEPRAAQLQTCFMKRYFEGEDDRVTVIDPTGTAYIRPDSSLFSGFSAVGLFHVGRFTELFGSFHQGELANDDFAKRHGIRMGLAAHPFMMWLPYPISFRGQKRGFSLQLVERLAGCGFYPYEYMSPDAQARLLTRPQEQRPYAEDWLSPRYMRPARYWSFAGGNSNLRARGGWRGRLGSLLMRVRTSTKKWNEALRRRRRERAGVP
jgi:glycosyltransferase involved in cell wall biosynthesis